MSPDRSQLRLIEYWSLDEPDLPNRFKVRLLTGESGRPGDVLTERSPLRLIEANDPLGAFMSGLSRGWKGEPSRSKRPSPSASAYKPGIIGRYREIRHARKVRELEREAELAKAQAAAHQAKVAAAEAAKKAKEYEPKRGSSLTGKLARAAGGALKRAAKRAVFGKEPDRHRGFAVAKPAAPESYPLDPEPGEGRSPEWWQKKGSTKSEPEAVAPGLSPEAAHKVNWSLKNTKADPSDYPGMPKQEIPGRAGPLKIKQSRLPPEEPEEPEGGAMVEPDPSPKPPPPNQAMMPNRIGDVDDSSEPGSSQPPSGAPTPSGKERSKPGPKPKSGAQVLVKTNEKCPVTHSRSSTFGAPEGMKRCSSTGSSNEGKRRKAAVKAKAALEPNMNSIDFGRTGLRLLD